MRKLVLTAMAALMLTSAANAGDLIAKSNGLFLGAITTGPWQDKYAAAPDHIPPAEANHMIGANGGSDRHLGWFPPGTAVSWRVADGFGTYGWNHTQMPLNGDDLVIEFWGTWFNPDGRSYTRPNTGKQYDHTEWRIPLGG